MKNSNNNEKKEKEYTYDELFKMSKKGDYKFKQHVETDSLQSLPSSPSFKFEVSSYNDINSIFQDIAYSKKARNKYYKINFIYFLFFSLKILCILSSFFIASCFIASKFTFVFRDFDFWKEIMPIAFLIFPQIIIIDIIFLKYDLTYNHSKIDKRYESNETGYFKTIWYGLSPYTKPIKNRPRSSYKIFKANNDKYYLVPENIQLIKNFCIRNWYLISKYITLGKMSINDLDKTFEDCLFIFLTTDNYSYEKNKIKLRSKCNPNFSLNFMIKLDGFIYFFFLVFICSIFYCFSIYLIKNRFKWLKYFFCKILNK